jgi:nucleoside-diphosphate-sugar epimerase
MSESASFRVPSRGRVLVTGAAGVMGAHLVKGLLERGFAVRCLVLPNDPQRARLEPLACEIREGNVTVPGSLSGLCADVDTVYHLAAIILSRDPSLFERVNRDGTAHLVAEAKASGVRHFIYVSSASVTYPKRTPYAESKWAAEQLVLAESAFQHTLVRPTLVYDENGGQEFLLFRDYLERFPVVPFIGDGHALKRPVWAEDIMDGLLRLAGNAASYGKVYNFSGKDSISMRDFAQLILAQRGKSRPFVYVPVGLCRALAFFLELVMKRPPLTASAIAGIVNDADLDPELATLELGYQPLGVRAGFARCFPEKIPTPLGTSSSLESSMSSGNSP